MAELPDELPLTPAELADARAAELAELTRRHGADRARAIMDRLDRQREADIACAVAHDPLLSPRAALAHYLHENAVYDAAMYRSFDEERRKPAGVRSARGLTAREDLHWAVPWAEACESERRRRTGDLVLDGHTLDEAHRLAPTAPIRPDALWDLMLVPLTANETLRARAEEWRELTEHLGAEDASSCLALRAAEKMANVQAEAMRDTTRSPTSAHIYAASIQATGEATIYRTVRRNQQLVAAGAPGLVQSWNPLDTTPDDMILSTSHCGAELR
jgi:hypothetical protein